MRFIYTGDCKAGHVRFSTPVGEFVLPVGQEVDVTFAPLAAKLAGNPEFVATEPPAAPDESAAEQAASVPQKRGPGRPRKAA